MSFAVLCSSFPSTGPWSGIALIQGDEFTFWGLKMCIFSSCCPHAQLHPDPRGFSPRDGCVICSCPCLPLFLRAFHPITPMPGSFINCMEIQMPPCHPTGCFTLPYLQADAHECSQQHQIRADLCFCLTDILGENLFSPYLQGRFSKQSSPQGPQNQRP